MSGEEGSFRVIVRAACLRRAEVDLRSKYPRDEVRLVFPLDGDAFFASNGKDGELETEYLVLETREDPAPGGPDRGR